MVRLAEIQDKLSFRFFGMRISNYDSKSGLFVASKTENDSKIYRVHKADLITGMVSNVGQKQGYLTIGQAKAALKRVLKDYTPD